MDVVLQQTSECDIQREQMKQSNDSWYVFVCGLYVWCDEGGNA